MTPDERADALASVLALRGIDSYPVGECAAWIDSADRRCGKPATRRLCRRHETVAMRRLEKEAEKRNADNAARAEKALRERPAKEARLEKVERRLDAIDPFRRETGRADRAAANLPISKRLPSDARIHELAQLHNERRALRRSLGLD